MHTVSSRGQTTVRQCSTITIAWSLSNDNWKSTVFSSQWNVASDGAFLTDDGRLFHARAEATRKARSPSVERLVGGMTSMDVSAESRRRWVSTSDVWRRPPARDDGTRNQWSSRSNGVMRSASLRKRNGLQSVLQLARDTSENWVAVVHLADNQCTNQGQQGMSWQILPHAPDLMYSREACSDNSCEMGPHGIGTMCVYTIYSDYWFWVPDMVGLG